MPDSSGKIRGISVPPVPWHEQSDESDQIVRIVRHVAGMTFPESGHPYGSIPRQLVYDARTALTSHETALRDADQMLWDKQTDEGPSALEKLRDK